MDLLSQNSFKRAAYQEKASVPCANKFEQASYSEKGPFLAPNTFNRHRIRIRILAPHQNKLIKGILVRKLAFPFTHGKA